MMKELLVSVVSGVVVALILQLFRVGGNGGGTSTPRQAIYGAAPPRRSRGGGLFRFMLAVIGGLVLAFAGAPLVLSALHDRRGEGGFRGRVFDGGGPGGYFDRGNDAVFGLPPLLVLTIICTIVVWVVLSALRRR
jgi:hypothetical protein